MLIKRCDLCKCTEELYSDEDTEYCHECATLINTMRIDAEHKIMKILKEQYNEVVTNSAGIMRLLKYLYTENREEFTKQFGTQGLDMLKRALGI